KTSTITEVAAHFNVHPRTVKRALAASTG
ncbi:recombinase family protein, partial [Burkholderia cenocepacia]